MRKLLRYTRSLFLLPLTSLTLAVISCDTLKKRPINQSNISLNETKNILYSLSHDSLLGRAPGTQGHVLASKLVKDYLRKSKIKPFYEEFNTPFNYLNIQTFNVVGLIGNKNRKLPHILLSAHLDHLGTAPNTLQLPTDTIFNGANDNASGVAAVLQIARALKNEKKFYKKNIILCFFSGEEDGLMGSKSLAKRFKSEKINLEYVINFDMIGTTLSGKPKQVYATGYLRSNLGLVLNKSSPSHLVNYLPEEKRYGLFYRSDNYPFYKELNIPAHTLSTYDFKNFDYYHHPQDELEHIDIKNLNEIINRTYIAISNTLRNRTKIRLEEKE